MPTAQPELKPNRRGLWLAVAVVVALLALTTWDVLRNSDRSSPAALRRAAFDGDEATVRRLIAAHPEWIDSVGSTNGQTRVLGGLFDKAMKALGKVSPSSSFGNDPEKQFQELESLGATPLFHATVRTNLNIAKLLAETGATARQDLRNGFPLIFAATLIGDTNYLSMLVARGARLDSRVPVSRFSLIHYGVFSRKVEMLHFLHGRGLSVNETNWTGLTPLHLAVNIDELSMVQFLATNGADFTLTTTGGRTACDLALTRSTAIRGTSAPAVLSWLEAFAATNQPAAKPAP